MTVGLDAQEETCKTIVVNLHFCFMLQYFLEPSLLRMCARKNS